MVWQQVCPAAGVPLREARGFEAAYDAFTDPRAVPNDAGAVATGLRSDIPWAVGDGAAGLLMQILHRTLIEGGIRPCPT